MKFTAKREAEFGGLMVVRNEFGQKVGTSQSEAAARLLMRNLRRQAAK